MQLQSNGVWSVQRMGYGGVNVVFLLSNDFRKANKRHMDRDDSSPPEKEFTSESWETMQTRFVTWVFEGILLVTNVVSNPFFRGWEGMIFPGSQVKLSQQVINLLKTKLNRAAKSTKGTLPRTGQLLIPWFIGVCGTYILALYEITPL